MVQETQHTIAILPEKAERPKVFPKRDIAGASTEQKETLKRTGRRARIDHTPFSSESEQPAAKKGKAKKREKAKVPDMTNDFDEGASPPLLTSRQTPP